MNVLIKRFFLNHFPSGIAVYVATSNNDPETLEAIVKWKNKGSLSPLTKEIRDCPCPMLLACEEEYSQCIKLLYNLGYRIELPKDVKSTINKIMELKLISNKIHFWWVMVKGNEAPHLENDHHYEEDWRMKSVGQTSVNRNHKNIFQHDGEDSVERSWLLKAYSNPYYLTAEFRFLSETYNRHEKRVQLRKKVLPRFDPLNRSLAIARYAELLSIYDCEYNKEYTEIKKVEYLLIIRFSIAGATLGLSMISP